MAALCWPSFSYSDSISPYYGYTPNAAANALQWSMGSVLPTPPGVDVNAVIYRYTPLKETEDAMKVHVQNENAQVPGTYIFRETDDWTGKPGNVEIRKVIGVGAIPKELWGDGSIEVEGNGEVTNASVIYTYKVTPCYDPQFDPNCPGYVVPAREVPEPIDLEELGYTEYDAIGSGDADQAEYELDEEYDEDEDRLSEREQAEQDELEEKQRKDRLEKALAAADNTAFFAQAVAQTNVLNSMAVASITPYYAKNIPGGTYRDTVQLVDTELPDNSRGLRNGFAQQLLHRKMVEMQYDK